MGIYVKGAKMPKACKWCEYTSCEKRIRSWHIERADNCPLVEVPEPHGDLVDRKEVARIAVDLANGRTYFTSKNLSIALTAATVIESEGE